MGSRSGSEYDRGPIGEVPKRLNGADCKSAGLRPTEVRILPSPPRFARKADQRSSPGETKLGEWKAGKRMEAGSEQIEQIENSKIKVYG